jgi:pyridoxamine 5'-phosphate oxidase
MTDLAALRKSYERAELDESSAHEDPLQQFALWLQQAFDAQLPEPNAMTLATVGPEGRPSTRVVLIKGFDARGIVWYTNYDSRKGRELAANPHAALLFPWHPLGRQVIVEGSASPVTDDASDAYWATRPRGSQIAAMASPQSQVIPDRAGFERRWADLERDLEGVDVPRPDNWGGFRVAHERVEFWQGRERRMHDRLAYRRDPDVPTGWRVERLAP